MGIEWKVYEGVLVLVLSALEKVVCVLSVEALPHCPLYL